jgi:hypothetical protein
MGLPPKESVPVMPPNPGQGQHGLDGERGLAAVDDLLERGRAP